MAGITVNNAVDLQQAVRDGYAMINIGSSFDLSALPGGGTQTGLSGASIAKVAGFTWTQPGFFIVGC